MSIILWNQNNAAQRDVISAQAFLKIPPRDQLQFNDLWFHLAWAQNCIFIKFNSLFASPSLSMALFRKLPRAEWLMKGKKNKFNEMVLVCGIAAISN